MLNKTSIMQVDFNNISLNDAVDITIENIKQGNKGYVVTPNAEIAYMCKTDDKLCNIINNAFLTLPDGIGVVYAAKILGKPLWGKVAGVEYGEKLIAKLADTEFTAFFLGGKPGVAKKAAENLKTCYPNLKIAGVRDGYFKTHDEAIAAINDVGGADVVFCCLGAPKQEFFMKENMDKINCRILAGLGGSLDVFAGEVQRAPDIFIKLGLEWFYRLIKQPSRIGRMMKLPMYMFSVIGYKLSRRGGSK